MRLPKFIIARFEDILQDFEDFAREHTAVGRTMDPADLRDHAETMLRAIVADARHAGRARRRNGASGRDDASQEPTTAAERHGSDRVHDQFTLDETVAEFRALRDGILRRWRASDEFEVGDTNLDDTIRFNDAVDQAMEESIGRYAAETRRLREATAAEAAGRKIAEEADRAKAAILQMMSHELRTPLNAIAGYTDLLHMGVVGPLTEHQRKVLGRMKRAERHLLSIIEGILDFQRLGGGHMSYQMEEMSLGVALAGLEDIVDPMAKEYSVAFSIESGDDGRTIWTDRDKLRQVLVNLISNAVRFTPEGGKVWLTVSEAQDRLSLNVHDTGKGIPPDKLEAIFEPFVQVDMGLTREQGGVGLGLAISKKLVDGMGGTIVVRSDLGHGSVFSVGLPKKPRTSTGPARWKTRRASSRGPFDPTTVWTT